MLRRTPQRTGSAGFSVANGRSELWQPIAKGGLLFGLITEGSGHVVSVRAKVVEQVNRKGVGKIEQNLSL